MHCIAGYEQSTCQPCKIYTTGTVCSMCKNRCREGMTMQQEQQDQQVDVSRDKTSRHAFRCRGRMPQLVGVRGVAWPRKLVSHAGVVAGGWHAGVAVVALPEQLLLLLHDLRHNCGWV